MDNLIKVVQGDVLEVIFTINGVESSAVRNIYFTSSGLNVKQTLSKTEVDNVYLLKVYGTLTKTFQPKMFSYDLTIEMIDGEMLTITYNNRIIVMRKDNKVNAEH